MSNIKIKNFQKKIKVNQAKLKRIANAILKNENAGRSEVSILLVDDAFIRKLNRKYLNKNSATDVLAFRLGDGEFAQICPQILGDVVISLDTACYRARSLKICFEKELSLYLIHGLLHLLGYEDKTRAGFSRMKRLQEEYLFYYA
ncbi:MAG: rRNA maturation RNase YbeY [Candidatus Omnitrophica bacterium]|nr:rRNA maturation RNase YbeY [Candidatus Omnitrophota bacterium]